MLMPPRHERWCAIALLVLLVDWLVLNPGTRVWLAHAWTMWGVLLKG